MSQATELEPPVHVFPGFGPKHECSAFCWCHPEVVNTLAVVAGHDAALLYVHNVAH